MQGHDHPDRLLIAVDCIIFGFLNGQMHILIIRREEEPYRGEWALMGGFLHIDESLDDAAARVLKKLTGVTGVYLEQFRAFGDVDRDGIERTVSVAYYALVRHEEVQVQLSADYGARWAPLYELPPLVFDHRDMVTAALRRLRYRAIHEPVAFQLLPERFTLSQLQTLYESIFNTGIDAGNFRRRLRKMPYLEQLDEKDLSTSKKGAYYYRLRLDQFEEAVDQGHEFLLKP